MAALVEMSALTKNYGRHRGVTNVSLDIQEGEVFGFLGPNGAGKTTTIRVLMGLLRPTTGRTMLNGLDCWTQSTQVKKLVGYLPGEFTFDPGLRGAQIIEYLGHLRGGVDQSYVRSLVERLGFDPSKRFREYSTGNKQKLGLVQAFMHRPRLLILDEPTSGLDPLNQQEFYRMLTEVHGEGRTIFLSSHNLPEVEHTCDRVAIIREGRLVKVDHVSSLKDLRQRAVEISFTAPAAPAWFAHVAAVTRVEQGADAHILQLNVRGALTEVLHIASEHGATNIETHEPSLEEVFLRFYEADQALAPVAGER